MNRFWDYKLSSALPLLISVVRPLPFGLLDLEVRMKPMLFLGGVLVGGAFGLMVGAAIVELPADGSGERAYPVVISMVLAIAGVVIAGNGWRRMGANRHQPGRDAKSI